MAESVNPSRAVELQEQLAADRGGAPYLLYRDDSGLQRLIALESGGDRFVIGRSSAAEIPLTWDARVSRAHATLERMVDGWTVIDDGRSLNGTFVNDERLLGRRRLQPGDRITVGATTLVYRQPAAEGAAGTSQEATAMGTAPPAPPKVTEAQRRVLVALARPFGEGRAFATPASNEEIAAELVLSLDAVKTHMRVLFGKFGLEGEARAHKRGRLVERAFESGVLSDADYRQTVRTSIIP